MGGTLLFILLIHSDAFSMHCTILEEQLDIFPSLKIQFVSDVRPVHRIICQELVWIAKVTLNEGKTKIAETIG